MRAGHSTGPRHGREHARAGKRAGPWQPAAAACAQAAFDCPHALPHGQYCERHRARPAAPHPTGSQPGVRAKRSEEEEEEERLREPRAKRARARRAHACHGPARTPTAARQQQHYPRWPAPACAARSPAACSPSCPLPQRKLLREVTVFLIGGSILRRRLACVRRRAPSLPPRACAPAAAAPFAGLLACAAAAAGQGGRDEGQGPAQEL